MNEEFLCFITRYVLTVSITLSYIVSPCIFQFNNG